MHDIRAIRENPDAFKAALSRRKAELADQIDELLRHDGALRKAIADKQDAETVRNQSSKLIGQAKAKGDEAEFERLRAAVAEAKETIETAGEQEEAARAEFDAVMLGLPNVPLAEVPEGADEHANEEKHRWGEPRSFDFEVKDHVALGEALGQMDFETAAKMSGSRFVLLSGQLARLERALAAFMLDLQTGEHGYTEVSPPLLMKNDAMKGTGQLPKFTRDFYFAGDQAARDEILDKALQRGEFEAKVASNKDASVTDILKDVLDGAETEEPYWLIPTSEVPLTNIVRETIIDADYLPRRYTAHTPCFRSEAGSAGRDTRGMIRLHQFNKVELVSIVKDEAEGLSELERMTGCAEEVLKRLELPFRRMLLCTGDMGFGARKTYDLEVWLPGQEAYREISSCSYCGDFQARRMNARWRPEAGAKPEFVHTLNGSGLAVGRTLVAVLENYQNADGSITVPVALRGYMGGLERIG